MKVRTKLFLAFLMIIITIIINWDAVKELVNESRTTYPATPPAHQTLAENTTEPELYFCPQDDCIGNMVAWIDAAQVSVHCAIYDIGLDELKQKLIEKSKTIDVKVVTDNDYYKEVSSMPFAKKDGTKGLMHNKFCVLDGKAVWTGSFNPTERDNYKNNNNAIFYQSQYLANAYEAEFSEMWNGSYGKGDITKNPEVIINGKKIEVCFAPEDWCANKIIYALSEANKTVQFMTFSFTHDGIGKELVELKSKGVAVNGVFETSQNNSFTEYDRLHDAGIDVRWDGNKYNMHNKVFIIDNSTVITGSFNPTSNADEKNDENLLIIHDASIAARFSKEFEKVWGEAET
jgi:phosphatidylserine/phosphatidylglycerophosphate/cardiolipin synthase-like enzyme